MAYRSYRSTMDFGFGYGITPAVKKLLLINVAAFLGMFLLQALGWGGLTRWLMLTPAAVLGYFAVWQLVTYMFLHGGVFHIFFNMLVLWMFGGELERTMGTRRFVFYYFLTGIGAGLCVLLVNPFSQVATLGASGAIFGILLAYGLLFPNRPIFVWFLFPVPAKYLVMILGAIELMSQMSLPGSNVSHIAHLGGLLVGFLYLRGRPYYFDLRNRYYRARRQRLQRQFRVYMNKRERDEEQRRNRWTN